MTQPTTADACRYCGGPVQITVVAAVTAPRCTRCHARQEIDPNVAREAGIFMPGEPGFRTFF